MNKLTQAVIEEIKVSEGLRLKAYPDPGSKDGLPTTIGYGTTRINGKTVSPTAVITKEQAEQYLIADLTVFASKVYALLRVKVTDAQFGALVSLAYNIGLGNFEKSTLLRILNAGDFKGVPAQFRRFKYNDGKVMQGLVNRREREIKMWLGSSTEPTGGSKPTTGNSPTTNKPKGFLELLIEFIVGLFKRS